MQLHTSHSNKELAAMLAVELSGETRSVKSVFQPKYIITPNKAQHQWLKEKLVEELNFVANLRQHSLNSFFREFFSALLPEKEKLEKEELIWRLFSEMGKDTPVFHSGNKLMLEDWEVVRNYCKNKTGKNIQDDEIKRLALAQKLAGLFENYQEYRPEMVEEWSKEENVSDWQSYLYHKAGYHGDFVAPEELHRHLQEKPEMLQQFGKVYLFGNLQLSPLQLKYLKVLKDFGLEIVIYRTHLSFSRNKNELAQSWGEHLENNSLQLQDLGVLREEAAFTNRETKLGQLQEEILGSGSITNLVKDDSILIYNSFTRVREVEALYNFLVRQVNENKELGARDIMVCMPSLDLYVSAIRTVFDAAPHKFPYTIVSRGYGREESFWTALEQLLSFEREDFTAPGVFNLLEMQPIQNSFGFSNLDLLRKAFIDANIRREYEGDERLETNYASFQNGLSRLVYGFCLGDTEPVEICGKKIYPVDIAEGQEAQDMFRLHRMVELLNDFLKLKEKKRSAKDWHLELMKLSEKFLRPEDWQQRQFQELMENLGGMQASEEEKIEFRTFFFRLKDQLHNKDLQQIKGNGGIIFCGLYPGMSMPKKIMAFLGLNFGEFPRKSQQLSFDKLQEEPRPNSRREDRGAFMEAFLNAEQQVLLSYIGQDVKDNSLIPPSALISELQDYTEKAGAAIREVKHPLHSFNSKYFEEKETDLFTYLLEKKKQVYLKCGLVNTLDIPQEIKIHTLESFLKDPFRHHYNHGLKIRYTDKGKEDLPEWEPFDLSDLENWAVKDRSLKNEFANSSLEFEELRKELLQNGKLPLKSFGEIKLEEADERVGFLLEKLEELEKNPQISEEEISLKFSLGNNHKVHLTGKVQLLAGEGLLLNVSKRKKDYELTAFVRYLVLLASGKAHILNYIHLNNQQTAAELVKVCNEWSQEEAYVFLKEWLQDLISNYSRIIPFSPKFNFEPDEIALLAKDVEGPEKLKPKIKSKFGRYGYCYPSPYLEKEYDNGFFEEEENLLGFLHKYVQYLEPVNQAFNQA